MYLSDDPHRDFDRWDADQQRERDRYPICEHCGEPVMDEYIFDMEGVLLHVDCAMELYRKDIEYYVE